MDIILDILKDEAKEMRTMIYDAGVSSFYLGKKGLAFVSCINTSEVRKMRPCKANLSHAYLIQADFVNTQCQGANFKDVQFNKQIKLQSGGEINKEAIKAIEDAQPYLVTP